MANVMVTLLQSESRVLRVDNQFRVSGTQEKFMERRGNETSPWIQAEIFEFLGKLYLKNGVTADTKKRYRKIRNKLVASVNAKSIKQWRLKNFDRVYELIVAR